MGRRGDWASPWATVREIWELCRGEVLWWPLFWMCIWVNSQVCPCSRVMCGYTALMALDSEYALACGSGVTSYGSGQCLSLGGSSPSLWVRSWSEAYTDLPKLRGTWVPCGDMVRWAPEWSPLGGGTHTCLSSCHQHRAGYTGRGTTGHWFDLEVVYVQMVLLP